MVLTDVDSSVTVRLMDGPAQLGSATLSGTAGYSLFPGTGYRH